MPVGVPERIIGGPTSFYPPTRELQRLCGLTVLASQIDWAQRLWSCRRPAWISSTRILPRSSKRLLTRSSGSPMQFSRVFFLIFRVASLKWVSSKECDYASPID